MDLSELSTRLEREIGAAASPYELLSRAGEWAAEALRRGETVNWPGLGRLTPGDLPAPDGGSVARLEVTPPPADGDGAVVAVSEKAGWPNSRTLPVDWRRFAPKQLESALTASTPVAVAVLDGRMPSLFETGLRLKANFVVAPPRIVAVFPAGFRPGSPPRLHVPPDAVLEAPLSAKALSEVVAGQRAAWRAAVRSRSWDMSFRFPSPVAFLAESGDFVERLCRRCGGQGGDALTALVVAIREATDNAARHGNGGSPERWVKVAFGWDGERVSVEVVDEGAGFSLPASPDRPETAVRERYRAGGRGGLGILLMRRGADTVEYNATGNTVRLTKRL